MMSSGNANKRLSAVLRGTIKPELIKKLNAILVQLAARRVGVFKGLD
ncbi:protein of unknown function [Candidatus Nitrotoga arctica]|uniref:Uncharacterized protein n=1 Tax=Candidatus Nitrotoga arctica TaxID=453162 RepID=A0ABN8AS56_9PROT|nr:protein of unknown function [Candidatus Nitrotoga arctica]